MIAEELGLENEEEITLYRLQACPHCERVASVLNEHGLDYGSRFVVPEHSERDVLKRISGKRTVPVLVDDRHGVAMSESENIIDYIETVYGERE